MKTLGDFYEENKKIPLVQKHPIENLPHQETLEKFLKLTIPRLKKLREQDGFRGEWTHPSSVKAKT